MADDVPFTVRVPESQHERWSDYVEDSKDLTSLNQLVRVGVEQEISDDGSSGVPEEMREEMEDLSRNVERLTREFDGLQDRLDGMQDTLREVYERTVQKNRLYRRLPSGDEDPLLVEEAAEYLDRPDDVAVTLLDELVLEYPDVETVTHHGATAYYRDGD